MTVSGAAMGRPVAPVDERVTSSNPLRRLLVRPEMGALAGSIAVWLFFAIVAGRNGFLSLGGAATYLQVAAELGILAVAVALLMIGGEFDLSVGSIIGATGMIVTVLSVQLNWNLWLALAVAIAFALAIGFFNGYLVLRTGLPSFIVTLATLYIV
ncbi:MAG: ABC transporter permease, partial [Chloroflexi bacterium]|nr:ABC transporter permease [Chloroflexota bacterium]